MNNRGKTKKQRNSAPEHETKSVKSKNGFSQEMRFVVTRNTRNAWLDDLYETAPTIGSLPTFH